MRWPATPTASTAAEDAGALIGPDTLERGARPDEDAGLGLENNDAHSFFKALDDQLMTGPTLTNVNDFRAMLILPR